MTQDTALVDLTAKVHAAYRAATPVSAAWHTRASRVLAGGVSGSVRYWKPYPLSMKSGEGAWVTDLDGRRYVDHFLCGACLLPGHRHPALMYAISATSRHGSLMLNDTLSCELAERVHAMVPCAERIRLLNSGTEAVMSALRFARAFTRRPVVIKFHGTYHGQGDDMLFGLDAQGRRLGAGITDAAVSQTRLVAFGRPELLAQALAAGDVAAVLLDPSMHHCGLWAGTAADYAAIRDAAHAAGALLVFDEVISGFRLEAGGAQARWGVTPDLAVFAKAFGGGEKIGAVTGRAEIMAVADPSRAAPGPFAYQSGTGNDVRNSVAAAIAALDFYKDQAASGGYARLETLARRLGEGLCAAFADHGIACHYNVLGPMVRLFLTAGPKTLDHCIGLDMRALNLFHLALITEGVLTIPGSNDFFLSFAHGDEEIDHVIAAAVRVLERFDFRAITEPLEGGRHVH